MSFAHAAPRFTLIPGEQELGTMAANRIRWGALALLFATADIFTFYILGSAIPALLRSYGHDVTLPAFLYFLQRTLTPVAANRTTFMVLYVACGCAAFEFAQLLGLYRGTFDPMDFVAYALGLVLAVGIDHAIVKGLQVKKACA